MVIVNTCVIIVVDTRVLFTVAHRAWRVTRHVPDLFLFDNGGAVLKNSEGGDGCSAGSDNFAPAPGVTCPRLWVASHSYDQAPSVTCPSI